MTTHKEALKLALEALENSYSLRDDVIAAKAAIKEALAQPEQEPVVVTAEMARAFHRAISDGPLGQADEFEIQTGLEAAFAHITTPPQRTWVGLRDEEAHELWESTDSDDDWELMKRTEAKLKEKNT